MNIPYSSVYVSTNLANEQNYYLKHRNYDNDNNLKEKEKCKYCKYKGIETKCKECE